MKPKTPDVPKEYRLSSDPDMVKGLDNIEMPISMKRADFDKMMLAATSMPIIHAAFSGYKLACNLHDIDEDDPLYIKDEEMFEKMTGEYREVLDKPTDFLLIALRHCLHEYIGLALKGVITPYHIINPLDKAAPKEQWEASKKVLTQDTIPMLNDILREGLVETKDGNLVTITEADENRFDDTMTKLADIIGEDPKELSDRTKIKRISINPGEDPREKVKEYLESIGVDLDGKDVNMVVGDGAVGVAIRDLAEVPHSFWKYVPVTSKNEVLRAGLTIPLALAAGKMKFAQ